MANYHHGDLPRAVLEESARIIAEQGIAALSLRDVARNIGVSHAAPAHHFGDKNGVLIALAIEGYQQLEASLKTVLATPNGNVFLEAGCAYVGFADSHPGHFAVMEQVDILPTNTKLTNARRRSSWMLNESASTQESFTDIQLGALGGWALAHGFSALWRAGSMPKTLGPNAVAAFRAMAEHLVRP